MVDKLNPPLEKDTAPGPVVPICDHGPDALGPRSTLKPLSLKELSVQDRSIRLEEKVVAVRLVGAAGGAGVVAVATFE